MTSITPIPAVESGSCSGDTKRSIFLTLGLSVWVGLSLVVGLTLMAGHWYTLPAPPVESPGFRNSLAQLRTSEGGAFAVHVLYGNCKCSQAIAEHLCERGVRSDVEEHVLLATDRGDAPPLHKQLLDAGFGSTCVPLTELQDRFEIESAPVLIVLDPKNTALYAGGYTSRKQGLQIQDRAILDSCIQHESPNPLPIFGCGASTELQAILDPLGIRYDR